MKGFIAVVLNLLAQIKVNKLKKTTSPYFSYDEGVSCKGIQKLVPFLSKLKPKPKFCIVGRTH